VLRIFWFRFFQKHEIWPRGRTCHADWILGARQDGRHAGHPGEVSIAVKMRKG